MNEAANTNTGSLPETYRLTELGAQARAYSQGMARNMIELGRVFTEAKALVKHGEWGEWLRENAGMSDTQARQLMRIWERFGQNPALQDVERSKLFRMLTLPEGTEGKFLEAHDVKEMSAREIEKAVKEARDEERAAARAAIDRERKARLEAEKAASDLAARPAEIPPEVSARLSAAEEAAREAREGADHFAELAKKAAAERAEMEKQVRRARAELDEANEMAREQQAEYDRTREELLALKSEKARGDAERTVSAELTGEALAAAVRTFIGTAARLPQMGKAFARMGAAEREEYETLIRVVEKWAEDSRAAMRAVVIEGTVA